ncbi:MAG: nucleotide exchange factor GrpE [bacterium]|nr:nucleotide exchange factor GrpE [bacterium]
MEPKDEVLETAEDAGIQEAAEPEAADETAAETEALKAEIAAKDERIAELEEKLKKMYADFDNFRMRKEAEAAEAKKYSAERIISEFLPIIDNFDRAIEASAISENYQALKEGLEMVNKQTRAMLEKEGLKPIEAVGQPFDPQMHQAIQIENNEELDDETVIRELLKGYKLHRRIIRPSMVIVNRKN